MIALLLPVEENPDRDGIEDGEGPKDERFRE